MSVLIGDGRGDGSLMEVKKHRAQVDAQTETAFERHSRVGQAYSWTNVGYNMTAADTVLAVRNTSSGKTLHITRVTMSSVDVNVAQHHITQGSAALAGTAVTGTNLNGNSGNVAEAEAKGDETTNSSQGTLIGTTQLPALTEVAVNWEGALILGTNDSYGIDYIADDTGSLPLITIYGYFEDKDTE